MKSKIVGFILFVILIICIAGALIYKMLFSDEDRLVNVVKVKTTISDYGYSLDDRDTEIMKVEFITLKNNLTSDNISYEEYASSLAKLYIIDLYTINNKVNIYDMPCLEYLLPENIDNFKTNLKNTMYLYLKDNSNGKRKQDLPIVKSIEITDTSLGTFKIGNTSYDSYEISLVWTYEKDFGYDKEATITIIKKDKKLYVVKEETQEQ